MAVKTQRNLQGYDVRDPSIIDNLKYNEAAGADKNMSIGPKLIPLGDGAGGFTTDASTVKILPKGGANLVIFNKSATVAYSATVGDSSVSAQAIGAVQAGTQFVGVACPPNTYTYISCGNDNYVVTNNNNLVVYLIDDNTYMVVESKANATT